MKNKLIGREFGRLTVIELIKNDRLYCKCLCSCGKNKVILASSLLYGKSKSCGCLRREGLLTHGKTKTPEFTSWMGMRRRCYDKNKECYQDYGGRGIIVCDRWESSFENFFKDMGTKPSPSHSIDRINNDGNYELSNCKWSTKREQVYNRRNKIVYSGETAHDASVRLGGTKCLIGNRLQIGWAIERAFSTPVGKYNIKKQNQK